MKYNYHTDAGHGWIAVPRNELATLGLLDRISDYSYQKGQTIYLEEDCDATLFANAKGGTLELNELYQETSPVRSYARYEK